MRYGIISDIHGNLEALESVLSECSRLKVESLVCAGDMVGYGANPKECLSIMRKLKIPAVAGNHDWAVSGKLDFSYFRPDGQAALIWTRARMSLTDISYLNDLPLFLKNKDFELAHGTLKDPGKFIYLTEVSQAAESFLVMDAPVCFVGHTHVPKVFIKHVNNIYQSDVADADINPMYKYIVNTGSVGQPRDRNPMSSFCIYDTQLQMIENHRVLYDIKTAQQKIIDANLPEDLARRLATGQ